MTQLRFPAGIAARFAGNAKALLRALGTPRFLADRRGNVAMIFAISLVPLAVAAGAGLDVARSMVVRNQMAEALDAAALAVGATSGLTAAQMKTLAQQYFNANFHMTADYGTPTLDTPVISGQSVLLTSRVSMPTVLVSLVGIQTVALTQSTTVVWGQQKLRVALVLDNSGSMCEPAGNPCANNTNASLKINALKTASHQLLTMLKNASTNAGDVMVSIVPFTSVVNVGTANKNKSWLTFGPWDTAGSGNGSYQWQNICDRNGRNCNWQQVWVASDSGHGSWSGCVMDRDQDYDTKNTTPGSNASTKFPADWDGTCPKQVMGLSTNWDALDDKIDDMAANGATNQNIGLAWGWQSLTTGDPLNAPALPDNKTQQVVILLTDGVNTLNRWGGNGSSQYTAADDRMKLTCAAIKAAGITIYTVRVMDGNESLLKGCATDAGKYFALTTSGQIVTAFAAIGQQITNLRVSR